MKTYIITLVGLLLSVFVCKAQDGNPDVSFGTDGTVRVDSVGLFYPLIFTAQQSDGRIVAATSYVTYNRPLEDVKGFIVKRFLDNGIPDPSFNSDCRIITGNGTSGETLRGMAVLSDGRIVLAGTKTMVGLLPDGTLDHAFGDSGKLAHPDFIGTGMALQSGERIILLGRSGLSVHTSRYFNDGKLDSTYGMHGHAELEFPGASLVTARAIIITPADNIIIGGMVLQTLNAEAEALLLQLNPSGTPDNAFGNQGYTLFTLRNIFPEIEDLGYQADGKIVTAGRVDFSTAFVTRFNANATIDRSFNGTGVVYLDTLQTIQSGSSNFVHFSMRIQQDGRILHAYNHLNDRLDSFGISLRRLRPDGTVDPTFGVNGTVIAYPDDFSFPGFILNQRNGQFLLAAAGGLENPLSPQNGRLRSLYLLRFLSSLNLGVVNFQQGIRGTAVYPNPISQLATLSYELLTEELISIELLDINGRIVQQFKTMEKQAIGLHTVKLRFNSSLQAGIYTVAIRSLNGVEQIRVTLL